MSIIAPFFIGVFFGIILIKSKVSSWFSIQKMFQFQEPHMYLVIGSAVAVGAISVLLIKVLRLRTVSGEEIEFKPKSFQKGTIIGGAIFGLGWAITGACPGPIYAQFGSGEYLAGITFVGAFLGTYLYALLRPRLPH
jgi:uncharacterized protein